MDFIEPFLKGAKEHQQLTGRPFVTVSYAQSLDGSISARRGEALPLSGRQSLKLTHQLRAGHDAILVGIGTVLADNPRLNVRLVNGANPRPVVVDSRLRVPLQCRLLNGGSLPPWVVTSHGCDGEKARDLRRAGAEVLQVQRNSRDQIDLEAMLRELAAKGITSLMVEGGARIITSFLMERLADYIVLTVAPVLVGGLPAVSDLGSPHSSQLLRLENPGHRKVGRDLVVWGSFSQGTQAERAY